MSPACAQGSSLSHEVNRCWPWGPQEMSVVYNALLVVFDFWLCWAQSFILSNIIYIIYFHLRGTIDTARTRIQSRSLWLDPSPRRTLTERSFAIWPKFTPNADATAVSITCSEYVSKQWWPGVGTNFWKGSKNKFMKAFISDDHAIELFVRCSR